MKTTYRHLNTSLMFLILHVLLGHKLWAEDQALEAALLNGNIYMRREPEKTPEFSKVSRVRLLVGDATSVTLRQAGARIMERIQQDPVLELGVDGENWYPVYSGPRPDFFLILEEFEKGSVASKFGRVGQIDLPTDEGTWKKALGDYDTLIVSAPKDFPGHKLVAHIRDMTLARKQYITQAASKESDPK